MSIQQFTYGSFRKLEGVVVKLEPLSDQHAIIRFLRNADNAGTLTGFVQELANAVADYQVRAAGPTTINTERPSRFHYNKECTRERGKFMTKPRTSITSIVIQRTS